MIWVGGSSIGFSGIFLVKYSLDNNLLGPEARILLALLIGALLHAGAYQLHRLKGRDEAFAALAGGCSLVLYSALFLIGYVARLWLWVGTLVGAFFWCFILAGIILFPSADGSGIWADKK